MSAIEKAIATNTQSLIDDWIEQEKTGVKFPVDFEAAWQIAGYARKDVAKRRLAKFREGVDISTDKWKTPQGGRSKEIIKLTCDAFKHFCLLAETEEGDQIRQYFIECEKKWRLVQQHKPEIAQEIEVMHLKLQLAQAEAQKALAEKAVLDTRHLIATTCPEPVQQKIFGYEVIKEIEYRDRVIHGDEIIRDGSTVNKTELCKRYGFINKNGNPDYAKLKKYLESANLPSEAWELTASILENKELRREYLVELDKRLLGSDRQMWIGE